MVQESKKDEMINRDKKEQQQLDRIGTRSKSSALSGEPQVSGKG